MHIKTIARIIGASIAFFGLIITAFSAYAIIKDDSQWWSWLMFALIGVAIVAVGLVLATEGFKRFLKAITYIFTPF